MMYTKVSHLKSVHLLLSIYIKISFDFYIYVKHAHLNLKNNLSENLTKRHIIRL